MGKCDSCGLWSRPGEEVHAVGCERPLHCPSCAVKDRIIEELSMRLGYAERQVRNLEDQIENFYGK